MDAIRYIADILSWLLLLAFVLRLMLQLVRADFRDPLADAVVRVTNWLVLPLRRGLPPLGRDADPRDRSDAVLAATGARPTAFLATLGPLATYSTRASFTRNLLAAGGIDAATVVSVLLISLGRTALLLLPAGYGTLPWLAGLRLTLTDLVTLVLKIYLFGLIVYWLIGFIAPAGSSPGSRLLSQLCEPVLRPVRRLIPPIGQIDFSPLWVCILISAALLLVR